MRDDLNSIKGEGSDWLASRIDSLASEDSEDMQHMHVSCRNLDNEGHLHESQLEATHESALSFDNLSAANRRSPPSGDQARQLPEDKGCVRNESVWIFCVCGASLQNLAS